MFSFLKRSRKTSPASRKASLFRPAFESLEDRRLLSATQTILSNGQLFTLDNHSELWQQNVSTGVIREIDGPNLAGGQAVQSFAVDPVHNALYYLEAGGYLWRQNLSWNSGPSAGGAFGAGSSFQMAPDGTVYVLAGADGSLYRFVPGQAREDVGAFGIGSSFQMAPDGTVYVLDGAGSNLYRFIPGQAREQVGTFGAGSTWHMAPDGTVYLLDGAASNLYRFAPGQSAREQVGTFGAGSTWHMAPDGTVYLLDGAGSNLYRFIPGQAREQVGAFGAGSTWQMAPDGTVYVLGGADGNLYRFVPGQAREDVGAFGMGSTWHMAPDGTVYLLDGAGSNLYRFIPGQAREQVGAFGAGSTWHMAPDGTVYVLAGADGSLYRFVPGQARQQVGTNGVLASDGSIWYLGTSAVDGAGDHAIYRLSNGQLTQVCITAAAIGSKWLGMGGPAPTNALGMPTGNERDTLDGTGQIVYFQNGAIYNSAQTGAVVKMGVVELSAAQKALFSADYLKFREHFLTLFLWNGMVAKYIDTNAKTITFGDQGLHMGFALETFANEAALFRRAGLDTTPAERVIQQLLNGFDQMQQAVATLFGAPSNGYFLRDTVSDQDRHGIPTGWTIASDFNKKKPDGTMNWAQTKIDTEMTQDQALHLFMGWRAVAVSSSDPANVRRAWQQCDSVLRFLVSQGWKITRPDGVAPTDDHNAGDFRYFAGFFSEIADQVTVAAGAKVGILPGMHSYFADPGNTIHIRIDLSQIEWGNGGWAAQAVSSLYSSFADLLQARGVGSVVEMDIPVSVIHPALLTTLAASSALGTVTGSLGLDILLPYLPGGLTGVSVRYPTTQMVEGWTYAYPWLPGAPEPPKVSWSYPEVVWQTTTIGHLLQTADLPLQKILDPGWGTSAFSMHLLLTALAFDPDPQAALAINTLASTHNDPWCLLLRASVLGQPVSGGILSWARDIQGDSPALTLGAKPTGQWVSTNRWEWATNYQTGSSTQINPGAGGVGDSTNTEYNRLDFLSLEGLLRLNGGL